jgi:hypothetical protein
VAWPAKVRAEEVGIPISPSPEPGGAYRDPRLFPKVDISREVELGMASGGVGGAARGQKRTRHSLCKLVAL